MLQLTRCAVCGSENLDFSLRCISCGSLLQQGAKTLDLFSTIYNLWRYPDFAFRKILLTEHRNYTLFIAFLEAIGLSFLSLFVLKAGDIFSIDIFRLVPAGMGIGGLIYLPFLYVFSGISYLAARVSSTGATPKGFIASCIYALHPIGLGAIIVLPVEIAVFGPYIFSNNPAPQIINPVPFYLLAFLGVVLAAAAIVMVTRLSKLLFGSARNAVIIGIIFFILVSAVTEITKRVLVK